jgi:hypothetical protein
MKWLLPRNGLVIIATLLSAGLHAAPIDITHGMITGALLATRSVDQSQGIPIEFPVWDWILDKSYTHRVVGYRGDEKDQSYVGLGPTRDYGFASAAVTGLGALEVGVANPIREAGGGVAVSRYNFRIKNNLDEPIAYLFEFFIERGLLEINGIRSDHTAHARVEAMIDYALLTPAGPFGGHYDETTGRLFSYYADIGFDNWLTHSDNATVTLFEKNDFTLRYSIDPYQGRLRLPEIPAHGEITVFYDMYSHLNIQRFEVGGYAMLGDPTDLTGGPGIRLAQQASQVPEPATMLLFGGGLVAIAALQRMRAHTQRRERARMINGPRRAAVRQPVPAAIRSLHRRSESVRGSAENRLRFTLCVDKTQ